MEMLVGLSEESPLESVTSRVIDSDIDVDIEVLARGAQKKIRHPPHKTWPHCREGGTTTRRTLAVLKPHVTE